MKKLITLLIVVLLFIGALYVSPTVRGEVNNLLSYNQCDTPLPYTIGSVDPKFGLSKEEVENDITTATQLWSTAEGKNLFTNNAQAQLKVNFVYDERQALNNQIDQLNSKLDENGNSLQQQIHDYEAQAAAFKQKLQTFKNTVDRYNREGGAPQDVYNQLIQQQKELQTEADTLNDRARELNLSTQDYNADVSTLNQDVNEFNNAISKKPEEGLYDSGNDTVTIYFANDKQELLHTLAHEFGHSLGMDHVQDPHAIMYPYTTKTFAVTQDDMQQLANVCREQSAPLHWAREFDMWIISHIQTLLHHNV